MTLLNNMKTEAFCQFTLFPSPNWHTFVYMYACKALKCTQSIIKTLMKTSSDILVLPAFDIFCINIFQTAYLGYETPLSSK